LINEGYNSTFLEALLDIYNSHIMLLIESKQGFISNRMQLIQKSVGVVGLQSMIEQFEQLRKEFMNDVAKVWLAEFEK
jgi:hypothetical protein